MLLRSGNALYECNFNFLKWKLQNICSIWNYPQSYFLIEHNSCLISELCYLNTQCVQVDKGLVLFVKLNIISNNRTSPICSSHFPNEKCQLWSRNKEINSNEEGRWSIVLILGFLVERWRLTWRTHSFATVCWWENGGGPETTEGEVTKRPVWQCGGRLW